MTNAECILMLRGLREVNAPSMNMKFNYAISKNIRKLESLEKSFRELIQMKDDYLKFMDEKEELNKKFAEKDENGEPKKKIVNQHGGQGQWAYVVPGDGDPKSEYSKAMLKLSEKHKDAIDDRSAQIKEYNAFMEDDVVDFNLHMIDLDIVPDGLSRGAMDAVYFMVKEPEEEKPIKKLKNVKKV
jgi:hypothetical protein